MPAPDVILKDSSSVLANCVRKLSIANNGISLERSALECLWEVDFNLCHQNYTDDLDDLNICFNEAQGIIGKAVRIIEKNLLPEMK